MNAALVDSHCHLDFPSMVGDLDGVVARAKEAGVGRMVTISTRVKRFGEITAIAERFANVFCSVGTHPHNAAEEPEITAGQLVELAEHKKCIAIGEAGLDYHYQHAPMAAQAEGFRRHIGAARISGLPLVVHTRDADEDTATILEAESAKGAFPFVLHCFSAGEGLAKRGLALGGYISFSGIVTFKNATDIQAVAQWAPADRILVETDAPYLAPVPHRGRSNEPAFVRHTAEMVARLRGLEFDALAELTSANFDRLFSKAAG
jgi:TatD DNase family protein